MDVMKTPGVYIREKNAFPNSVVEVATAVPAFVGYTMKATDGNKSLLMKPFRISSMAEFHTYFGGAPTPVFSIEKAAEGESQADVQIAGKTGYWVRSPKTSYTLYYNLLLFYANGGGPCYIVSVGDYSAEIGKEALVEGIQTLTKELEPTLLVVPEAVNLSQEDCTAVQQAMLMHCGNVMKNRFAILDVYEGKEAGVQNKNIEDFRTNVGGNFLAYGAAYFPWVNTSILSSRDVDYKNLEWEILLEDLKTVYEEWPRHIKDVIDHFAEAEEKDKEMVHAILMQNWNVYKQILEVIRRRLNVLPPSAAMAGIYTMVDNTRGVWKAPANMTLNNVVMPSVNITHEEQEELNVPLSGKAINAIRFFQGEGIKVWGARTLDGNSLDWRYINVRRTMIFLEESVKNAARAYVFEPNDAGTWLNMKSMIDNFLQSVWKRGGLAGAVPEDAFSVHVGLGDTMTAEDILEGILRITVLVALSRPAEFIEITFQQQMQKS